MRGRKRGPQEHEHGRDTIGYKQKTQSWEKRRQLAPAEVLKTIKGDGNLAPWSESGRGAQNGRGTTGWGGRGGVSSTLCHCQVLNCYQSQILQRGIVTG